MGAATILAICRKPISESPVRLGQGYKSHVLSMGGDPMWNMDEAMGPTIMQILFSPSTEKLVWLAEPDQPPA